jgi:hypothetical protein
VAILEEELLTFPEHISVLGGGGGVAKSLVSV